MVHATISQIFTIAAALYSVLKDLQGALRRVNFKMRFLKTAAVALTVAVCLLCTSCGTPELKHDTLVYQAREDYAALDSAKVVITNEDTGDIEQEFTFKYDEKDVLTYSYYGKNGGKEYAQYNNGIESYTYDNGEYSHLVKGDKDFSKYTRKAKHPQADEGMLMFAPKAVESVSDIIGDDGSVTVTYVYDVSKLGKDAEEIGTKGFSTTYFFDKDGGLEYFTENTVTKDAQYNYRVDITERNSVDKIENNVEQYKDK